MGTNAGPLLKMMAKYAASGMFGRCGVTTPQLGNSPQIFWLLENDG